MTSLVGSRTLVAAALLVLLSVGAFAIGYLESGESEKDARLAAAAEGYREGKEAGKRDGRAAGRRDGETGATRSSAPAGNGSAAGESGPRACPTVDLPDGNRGDEVLTIEAIGVSCAEAEQVGRALTDPEGARSLGYTCTGNTISSCTKGSARVTVGFYAR